MNQESSSPYYIDPKGVETLGNAVAGWFEHAAKPFEKQAKKFEHTQKQSQHLNENQFPEPAPAPTGPSQYAKGRLTTYVKAINAHGGNLLPEHHTMQGELKQRFGGKRAAITAVKKHKFYNPNIGHGF